MNGITVGSLERFQEYVGQSFVHPIYGEYTITSLAGREAYLSGSQQYCIIKFKKTGYECRTRLSSALKKTVKDPYYPVIAGVGYIGEPEEVYDIRTYYILNGMIDRVYDPNNKDYKNYGAKGVTVDPRWHCFANFLYDFNSLPGYEEYANASESAKKQYCLDKDILQQGCENKIYSKDTCMIVPNDINLKEMHARRKINDKNDYGSKYLGVHRKESYYSATISKDGKEYYLGSYDDEIAAATVYNYVVSKIYNNISYNNVPYMDINDALSHYIGKNPIEFPFGIDMSDLKIPYKNHSKFYGVKKKRNNFYALYHNKNGSQHIGIFDDEIAAASAHNIYMRLMGDGVGKYNKESDEFHEMSLDEVMMHRTYTKATEPKVMTAAIVDKETNELKWYGDYTYKSKFPPYKIEKYGTYTLRPIINGIQYHCGTYTSKDAVMSVNAIINRYFNLCYDPLDIKMGLYEALKYKLPNSIIEWPAGFIPSNWETPLQLRALQPMPTFACSGPCIYNSRKQMCKATEESDDERRARVRAKYGIDFI